MKEENKENGLRKSKAGRKPSADPAIFKYYIYLNSLDNIKFETLFALSGFKYRSHFIRNRVLNHSPKLININKPLLDYAIKLSQFRRQFRGIATNYNQLLSLLTEQFGKQKAPAYLYGLEKVTIDLIGTQKILETYINRFEERWLQK